MPVSGGRVGDAMTLSLRMGSILMWVGVCVCVCVSQKKASDPFSLGIDTVEPTRSRAKRGCLVHSLESPCWSFPTMENILQPHPPRHAAAAAFLCRTAIITSKLAFVTAALRAASNQHRQSGCMERDFVRSTKISIRRQRATRLDKIL